MKNGSFFPIDTYMHARTGHWQFNYLSPINRVGGGHRNAIVHLSIYNTWDFCAFAANADKLLIGLSSNLTDELIILDSWGLVNFRTRSTEFLPFPGLWFVQQTIPYRLSSSCPSTGLINFRLWFAECLPFLDFWLVQHLQTTYRIDTKFSGWTHHRIPQAWMMFSLFLWRTFSESTSQSFKRKPL